jgi:hypothetical protein
MSVILLCFWSLTGSRTEYFVQLLAMRLPCRGGDPRFRGRVQRGCWRESPCAGNLRLALFQYVLSSPHSLTLADDVQLGSLVSEDEVDSQIQKR